MGMTFGELVQIQEIQTMQWDEVLELACLMLGNNYDDMVNYYGEDFETELDEIFYEKYNITLEDFEHILKDLIKFTPTWRSPITYTLYQGFVTKENDSGLMRAVIKEEV